MKIKLDSIILFVHHVEQLKLFYVETFQFDIIEEQQAEWILLNAGDCNIALHKVGEQYLNTDSVKYESNTKMVFEVDNLNELREALIAQNLPMSEIKTFENYNYWICDGADPERNIFQLKQKIRL